MYDKNLELLSEYIENILKGTTSQPPIVNELSEPYQGLGRGLQEIQSAIHRLTQYADELSNGNLSVEFPDDNNFLCANLQTLHSNLNQIARRSKQVAEGNYTQQVENPGDFSASFNGMTNQIKKREAQLKEEAAQLKEEAARLKEAAAHIQHRAEMSESHNELLIKLLSKRNEWLLVVDKNSRKILYCNKQESEETKDTTFCRTCKNRLSFQPDLLHWNTGEQYKVWELDDENDTHFRITSFPLEWKEFDSYVHIVVDITDEKRAAQDLTSKAYHDPGTGIKNRLFFKEYMDRFLSEKRNATLCYLDLDGLKYVNDVYGHLEGDMYIQNFVELIRNNFRSGDTFARIGGDEFCLVLTGSIKELIEKKLAEILNDFQTSDFAEYQCSFSYGVVDIVGADNKLSLDELLQKADDIMYECKRKNKEKYPALVR